MNQKLHTDDCAKPASRVAIVRQNACSDAGSKPLYHKRGKPVFVYDGRRSVCVGTLLPDGCFVKRIGPQHILRTPPAIALQEDAVMELQRRGCVAIRVEVSDGRVFSTSFDTFLNHRMPLDRGYGKQMALALSEWQEEGTTAQGHSAGDDK